MTGMTGIQRNIDQARGDLEMALEQLELAARDLATARHWKLAAERTFRKRPAIILGVALLIGYRLGRARKK